MSGTTNPISTGGVAPPAAPKTISPVLRGKFSFLESTWTFEGEWAMSPDQYDRGIKSPFKYTHTVTPLESSSQPPSAPTGAENRSPPSGIYNGFFVMATTPPVTVHENGVVFEFSPAGEPGLQIKASGTNQYGVFDLAGSFDASTGCAECTKVYRPVAYPASKPKTPRTPRKRPAKKATPNKTARKRSLPSATPLRTPGAPIQRQPSTRKRKAPRRIRSPAQLTTQWSRKALAALGRWMDHRWAGPFNQPVDAELLGLKDYHTVISRPMDLRTIRETLSAGEYNTVGEFLADTRLVFSNATTYNPPKTDVHIMAVAVLKQVEKDAPALLSAQEKDDAAERDAAAVKRARTAQKPRRKRAAPTPTAPPPQYEYGYAPPPPHYGNSKKDVEIDLLKQQLEQLKQQVAIMATSGGGGGGRGGAAQRPLSFEEKRQLSVNINKLPGDKLSRVVSIIRENGMPVGGQGDDEIEIDMDALNTATLRRLQRYVKSVLGNASRRASSGAGRKKAAAKKGKGGKGKAASGGGNGGGATSSLLESVEAVEQGTQQQLDKVRAQLEGLKQKQRLASQPGGASSGGGEAVAGDSRLLGSALFGPRVGGGDSSSTDTSSDSDSDLEPGFGFGLPGTPGMGSLPGTPAVVDTAPVADDGGSLWNSVQNRDAERKERERARKAEEERLLQERLRADQERKAELARQRQAEEDAEKARIEREEQLRLQAQQERDARRAAERAAREQEEQTVDLDEQSYLMASFESFS